MNKEKEFNSFECPICLGKGYKEEIVEPKPQDDCYSDYINGIMEEDDLLKEKENCWKCDGTGNIDGLTNAIDKASGTPYRNRK